MATSEVFASLSKVETAFVAYSDGNLDRAEREYEQAVEHAKNLMLWMARMQSAADAHVAWFDRQTLDPEVDALVRRIEQKDLADLLVRPDHGSEQSQICESVIRSVQADGYRSVVLTGLESYAALQSLARDLFVSLETARGSIRRGELFEALFFRLEPTYLERTFNELVSGLIRLTLVTNCAAAIDRVEASKRIDAPRQQ